MSPQKTKNKNTILKKVVDRSFRRNLTNITLICVVYCSRQLTILAYCIPVTTINDCIHLPSCDG